MMNDFLYRHGFDSVGELVFELGKGAIAALVLYGCFIAAAVIL